MDLEGGAEAGAGAGARQTCECVSSSVAEVVHSIQHLLLGAKVIQVPLGLGGSTVLSQTWKGRSPHSTESDWEGRGLLYIESGWRGGGGVGTQVTGKACLQSSTFHTRSPWELAVFPVQVGTSVLPDRVRT